MRDILNSADYLFFDCIDHKQQTIWKEDNHIFVSFLAYLANLLGMHKNLTDLKTSLVSKVSKVVTLNLVKTETFYNTQSQALPLIFNFHV